MSLLKGTRVTWLGHATVLVQLPSGVNLLIDPFIEHNPKYPKDFALPEKIDYVLLTHAHAGTTMAGRRTCRADKAWSGHSSRWSSFLGLIHG